MLLKNRSQRLIAEMHHPSFYQKAADSTVGSGGWYSLDNTNLFFHKIKIKVTAEGGRGGAWATG